MNLINPDIVFCCGTFDEYADQIGLSDPIKIRSYKTLSKTFEVWKDENRMVIKFCHPSNNFYEGGMKVLYNDLCELLQDGKIFDHFKW